MARKHKTVKCNRLFILEFVRALTKIMKVKINVTDGFKKGRNHPMPWDLQGNLGFLFKGVKQSTPKELRKSHFSCPRSWTVKLHILPPTPSNSCVSIPCIFSDQRGGKNTGHSIGKVNYSRGRGVEDWTSGTSAVSEPQHLKFIYGQDTGSEILMICTDMAKFTLLQKTNSKAGTLEA